MLSAVLTIDYVKDSPSSQSGEQPECPPLEQPNHNVLKHDELDCSAHLMHAHASIALNLRDWFCSCNTQHVYLGKVIFLDEWQSRGDDESPAGWRSGCRGWRRGRRGHTQDLFQNA